MPVQDVRQLLRLTFRPEGTVTRDKGRKIMIVWLSVACEKFA